MKTIRLSVRMRDVEPPVVRVIDVPAAATLSELHDILQAAFGWTDSHLHEFATPSTRYGPLVPDFDTWDDDLQDEADFRLTGLGERFVYRYDFGDNWVHDVEVLGSGASTPGCVGGDGACPPEDCGGPGGYADLFPVLADPADPEHDRIRDWTGGRLVPFDVAVCDGRVHQAVGSVPQSVRLLLDLLADGVKLTPGGRLPRAVARAVEEQRPHWYGLDRPAAIEDDLQPLLMLHRLLRDVGLLRLRHGILAPTKVVADELAVVRRLRSAFPPTEFASRPIESTTAVLIVGGPLSPGQIAVRVHPMLGDGWRIDGRALTVPDVRDARYRHSAVMSGLDLVERTDRRAWAAGSSAQSLPPRVAILADHLGPP